MQKIAIEMNRGGQMIVEADGTFNLGDLDTFECYWPGKREYRVIPEHLYNVDKAAQAFEEAVAEERYRERYG